MYAVLRNSKFTVALPDPVYIKFLVGLKRMIVLILFSRRDYFRMWVVGWPTSFFFTKIKQPSLPVDKGKNKFKLYRGINKVKK